MILPNNPTFDFGHEVCRERKMDILINSALCDPDLSDLAVHYDTFMVDYVRVYKPSNLPAYTGGNDTAAFNNYYTNQLLPAYAGSSYKSTVDWNIFSIQTEGQFFDYRVLSDLNIVQGGGKYIYKGSSGLLWNTYWYNGQYYSVPLSWTEPVTGDITTSQDGDIIFYRNKNRARYWQGNVFRDVISQDIVAGSLIADESGLNVYFIDLNGQIRHCQRASISSHSWSMSIFPRTNINGKLIINPTNPLEIFYRTSSNILYRSVNIGGSWSEHLVGTSPDVTSEFTISANGDEILYKSTLGLLRRLTRPSFGTYWTLSYVFALFPGASDPFYVDNVESSISIADNLNQIYYKGTDNRIWVIYLDANNVWQVAHIDRNVDYVDHGVGLSYSISNGTRVSFVGTDSLIRQMYWGPCEVFNPECGDSTLYFKNPYDPIAFDRSIPVTQEVVKERAGFSFYPNPVSETLYIESDLEEIGTIELIDMAGRVISTYDRLKVDNFSIDLSSFVVGVYYLRITNDLGITVHKILKN